MVYVDGKWFLVDESYTSRFVRKSFDEDPVGRFSSAMQKPKEKNVLEARLKAKAYRVKPLEDHRHVSDHRLLAMPVASATSLGGPIPVCPT